MGARTNDGNNILYQSLCTELLSDKCTPKP